MSRTLVISDIHNRYAKVQKLLETVEYDQCIMLGDFFDNFNDFPEDARLTAMWLRDEVIPNKKITLLTGNHDFAYFYAYNKATRCSGYSDAKHKAIFSVLDYDTIRENFKWFHVAEGFLFSHAGITNKVWKDMKRMEPEGATLLDVLPKWIAKSDNGVRTMTAMPLFEAGWTRGGPQEHGGILWADWSEFGPISGVNQIVGHTPHSVPEINIQFGDGLVKRINAYEWAWSSEEFLKRNVTSINFALDTHSHHFMIIEDGKVQLWDWDLMMPMTKGAAITTPNGLPFSPDTQIVQPDYGVFTITYPNGDMAETTGLELCRWHMHTLSSSNVVIHLANLLKTGCKVAFTRRKKIRMEPFL